MTPSASPCHDVLAVTIGPGGIRARRTGQSDAADSFLELPDAPVEPGAAALADLVAAVQALTERDARPPEGVVWAVPQGWSGGAAAQLYAVTRGQYPSARVAVVAHLFACHVGAFGAVRPGTCLEVGTGSAALVTDLDQVWHRVDGWGPLLGGRGSGGWMGAQGLAAGLRWRDGVPNGSAALLAAGRAVLGDEETWPALLAGADAEVALTTFAPAVAEAGYDDAIAREILRQAGEALADALLAGRALVPGTPIVAVGGLLYLEGVRVALASALGQRQAFLVPGLGGALEGARLIGDHLVAGGVLPHRPPYVVLNDRREIAG